MEFRDDLYAILGIPDYSNATMIKQAYHSLAKKYHPDINNNGAKVFIEISDAYKILSNPESKQAYDDYLLQKQRTDKFESLKQQAEATAHKNEKVRQEILNTLNDIEELLKKKQVFNKAATKTLHETVDENWGEQLHNDKYYVNPKNEPVFTVIQNFNHYRFENALGAIWNRSFFVLFFSFLLYSLVFVLSTFVKLFHIKIKKHNYTYHWLLFLNRQLVVPKVIKSFFWSISLAFLTVTKFIANILYSIYWTFRHLIVPFLLPNAVRSLKR